MIKPTILIISNRKERENEISSEDLIKAIDIIAREVEKKIPELISRKENNDVDGQ